VTAPLDLAGLVRELVQQQTALAQQQTALLQLQSETLRMQRLLVERALGLGTVGTEPPPSSLSSPEPATPSPQVVVAAPGAAPTPAADVSAPGPDDAPAVLPAQSPEPPLADESPAGDGPRLSLVPSTERATPEPTPPPSPAASARASRYLQAASPRPPRPVTRQDVERITRLYEAGDAAHLVVQFGEYKGATLFQVAEMDPDYVRRLALTAQRPQVRAAARQLVVALEASEPATKSSRSGTRRVRADGR
jgi:hypothetical protein